MISPLNTGNIVIEKLVDTFPAHLANSSENADNLLNVFEQIFDENVKKLREN